MSRFAQTADAADSEELWPLYRDMIASGFGKDHTPYNWFTSQSIRPDILAGNWSLTRNLMLHGELPPIVKQMIVVCVSAHNDCNYCKCVHGQVLAALGVSRQIIESCVSDPDLKAVRQPHRAILEFAIKTAATPAEVTEQDVDALRDQGVSKQEIVEIIALSAYCNFINTWADLSRIPVDPIGQ